MGNSQCAPRAHGENVKDFLRRKFGCISRKRRIDDLVILAIQGDETRFKILAGGIRFKKQEIARFYRDRDAVLDEFAEDVLEIEMCNFGHETPSEYSDSEDSSDDSETPPSCIEMTPVAPVYSDPFNQRLYEEYCRKAWRKELGLVSVSDLPELDKYKSTTGNRMTFTEQHLKNNKVNANVGGGEKPGTSGNKGAKNRDNGELRDDEIKHGGKHHVLRGNVNISGACLTNPRSAPHNVTKNKKLLENITVGLRQRSATPSRCPSMLKKENVKENVGADKVSCSSVNSFGEDSFKDPEADNDLKNKKEDKSRPNFLRRMAAKFRRWRNSRTAPDDNIIHVQPAKINTSADYMPPYKEVKVLAGTVSSDVPKMLKTNESKHSQNNKARCKYWSAAVITILCGRKNHWASRFS